MINEKDLSKAQIMLVNVLMLISILIGILFGRAIFPSDDIERYIAMGGIIIAGILGTLLHMELIHNTQDNKRKKVK